MSTIILSGSVDRTIRVWQSIVEPLIGFKLMITLEGHDSSVNCLGVSKGTNLIASGSADATIRIWKLNAEVGDVHIEHLQTIQTDPKFFPLALALQSLGTAQDLVLAVAGTKSIVQVYVASKDENFFQQATLTGHEGWIRSLTIAQENSLASCDLLLASASQDKYIRLWRITKEKEKTRPEGLGISESFEKSLSNKAHKIVASGTSYSLTFEALLMGHEDWIYTISWRLENEQLLLLSASADNSLAIWQLEESSGMWVCTTRLGEISAQKGSTTATGTTGGFWIGLWSPSGKHLACLGRTGSWRLWSYDRDRARWVQGIGISGHTKSVKDLAWSSNGSYLLSTGSDQTTRLHAASRQGKKRCWHEMARPQIHGYDINCIDSVGQTQFISGADEKLLRVFDEPRTTANLLSNICGIQTEAEQNLPDAANIPVLGLSNKAIESGEDEEADIDLVHHGQASEPTFRTQIQVSDMGHPPFEDQLARQTLWPEREKLYGHGYEISAVAATHDGSLVATSCRASSLDHAVIRLYTTQDWREVKPSLTAHSLTVTSLRFSKDDQYLLSVGRDRQWALFERDGAREESYLLKHLNPKGHSRMVLNACWAPIRAGRVFATAGRDKTVKIWRIDTMSIECVTKISVASPGTAIDIAAQLSQGNLMIAVGTEAGDVTLYVLELLNWSIKETRELDSL